jgi:hypothetical protein
MKVELDSIVLVFSIVGGFMLFVRAVPLWFSAIVALLGCLWLLEVKHHG